MLGGMVNKCRIFVGILIGMNHFPEKCILLLSAVIVRMYTNGRCASALLKTAILAGGSYP